MKRTPWHLILRPSDGWPLLTTPESGLTFARVLASFTREYRIVAFNAVVDHGHDVVFGTRAEVGMLNRCLKLALMHSLGLERPFQSIPPRPIESAKHLERTIHYTFKQPGHHGMVGDPLHVPSNLGDLLGYRVLAPETRVVLSTLLPEFDRRILIQHLAGLELVAGSELAYLAEAAAAAAGLPSLDGRGPLQTQARIAAVRVGRDLDATSRQLSQILEISIRAVNHLLIREPDARLVRATSLQIGLREQIGRRGLRPEGTTSPHTRLSSR